MSFKRNFLNTDEIDCDLFKLEQASARVNHGISEKDAYWVTNEHTHFFRTHDSEGKTLNECAATCGHKHDIQIIRDKKDPEKIIDIKCVPAKWANDQHIHVITYKYSSKIKRRVWNPDVQALIARND
jgi:hypothetical protein